MHQNTISHPYITGLLLLGILLLIQTTPAFAANLQTDILSGASGQQFNQNMSDLVAFSHDAARLISTIMVCAGGLMVAFNMDSGHKLVWNVILGAGLAMFAAESLASVFTPEATQTASTTELKFPISLTSESDWSDFLTGPNGFMQTFHVYTQNAATVMKGPASKILLILTAVTMAVKLSLDLITGDKIRYLTETVLQTGVYLFLIQNWYGPSGVGLNIMESLYEGFDLLGAQAAGNTTVVPNNILANACTMFSAAYNASSFSVFSPVTSLGSLIMLLIMMIFLFLAGIELLMAKIEFWVMAMLTIPLIGFVPLPQTKFLFESALGAMMNCAIKVCVISFISCLSSGILTDYVKKFTEEAGKDGGGILGNVPLLIQSILVSFILYMMIKKIPALVQGLLSGRPDLGGGASMMQMAKSTASTAAKTGTAVATGGASFAKATVGGAMEGGFKAAGKAAANRSGIASQLGHGMVGSVAGGLNAGAGSLMAGAGGLGKQFLFGNGGASKERGGTGGSTGLGGGLLAPFQRGANLGKTFDNKKENGQPGASYKTFTSQTGIDKVASAVGNFNADRQKNGFKNAASTRAYSAISNMKNAVTTKTDISQNSSFKAGVKEGLAEKRRKK